MSVTADRLAIDAGAPAMTVDLDAVDALRRFEAEVDAAGWCDSPTGPDPVRIGVLLPAGVLPIGVGDRRLASHPALLMSTLVSLRPAELRRTLLGADADRLTVHGFAVTTEARQFNVLQPGGRAYRTGDVRIGYLATPHSEPTMIGRRRDIPGVLIVTPCMQSWQVYRSDSATIGHIREIAAKLASGNPR